MDLLTSGTIPANHTQQPIVATPQSDALPLAKGQIIEATVQRAVDSLVWLEINGITLRARAEVPLPAQGRVTLEVTQADARGIILRPVAPQAALSGAALAASSSPQHKLETLLAGWGVETDAINLTIAKALLAHNQAINPADILAVRALWRNGANSRSDLLQSVAYLYSNRLPVSEESISLAQHWLTQPQPIARRLDDLQRALGDALRYLQATPGAQPAPAQLRNVIGSVLNQLADWSISPDLPAGEIVARLGRLVSALNTPPEAGLARQATGLLQPAAEARPHQTATTPVSRPRAALSPAERQRTSLRCKWQIQPPRHRLRRKRSGPPE